MKLWDRVLEYSLKQKNGVSNQIWLDAMTMSQGNYFLHKAFSRKILIMSTDRHMNFIDSDENMIPTVYLTSEKLSFNI